MGTSGEGGGGGFKLRWKRYDCYENCRLNKGGERTVAGQAVVEREDDGEDGNVAAEEWVASWERGVRKE